jgi:hypothetical protein
MKAYLKIARQLNANKEYEKAAIVLKNTLKVSWITNDAKVEIQTYEMLALQYFYLQDLG